MIWLVFLTGGIYFFVIASFFYGWESLKPVETQENEKSLFVSVIVPMRNEEKNISNLLHDLNHQSYPSNFYEIILIDDHSTDQSFNSASTNKTDNTIILTLPEDFSGKKTAINYGIKKSKGELIITTDADCRIGHQWIKSIASFYQQTKPVMIMAPVIAYTPELEGYSFLKNVLSKLLSLELFSLLGSTAGSAAIKHPIMCNGANLAFPRSVYTDIEYVYKNKDVKSGDDIFAMLELKKKYPGRVHFLKSKDATVSTELPSNIVRFFNQRSRWASKSKYYRDPFTIFTALMVLETNVSLFISLIYGILNYNFIYFFVLLIIKSIIDFPFLYRITAFFGERKLMFWFPLVQSLYFLYVCTTIIVAITLPMGWKGRRF